MAAHRRSSPHRVALALTGLLVALLAACSDDSASTPLEEAQANVAAKEEALTEAEAAATAAAEEFCTASSGYITAIDRYGDVLNVTETTVGDVRDAGSDLEEPREEAQRAMDEVAETREAVAVAAQELAEAQAALASAAGTTPPPEPASASPTTTSTDASASIARMEEAEAELADAQAGITDETALTEAGEQFNAAVVALEMSWLRLVWDSGCLTEDQQQEAAEAVSTYVTTLQQALADLGYYEGEVDGVYGPETVAAVEALQEANGLPQTGTLDKATEEALRAELAAQGGAAAQQETAATAALQQTLRLAGYWDGPVDGQWTDALTDALEKLQEDLGVEVTGTVDAATIAAFEKAVAELVATPSPTTSTPASPEPTTTTT